MSQNQPKLLPLYLITFGSVFLAIPGSFGTLFLIDAVIHPLNGKFDELALLLPVSLIGYFLLFGYVWTVRKKRFVKWFWKISMIYNLLITLVSTFFIIEIASNIFKAYPQPNGLSSLWLILFPLWTLFVTIASAQYAFFKPTNEDLNLP